MRFVSSIYHSNYIHMWSAFCKAVKNNDLISIHKVTLNFMDEMCGKVLQTVDNRMPIIEDPETHLVRVVFPGAAEIELTNATEFFILMRNSESAPERLFYGISFIGEILIFLCNWVLKKNKDADSRRAICAVFSTIVRRPSKFEADCDSMLIILIARMKFYGAGPKKIAAVREGISLQIQAIREKVACS